MSVETEAPDACQRLAMGERFSAVLVDLIMPGMNGVDLYEWMTGACPEQADRVLFVTGAMANVKVQKFLQRNAAKVVPKPFNREILVARIETMLSGG